MFRKSNCFNVISMKALSHDKLKNGYDFNKVREISLAWKPPSRRSYGSHSKLMETRQNSYLEKIYFKKQVVNLINAHNYLDKRWRYVQTIWHYEGT